MQKKNLVIVRAGNTSLHEAWLEGAEARNWDIIINYYGDDPDRYRTPDVERIDSKGPKWPALYELIVANRDRVLSYDYIWLPDDDLMARKADINLLFETCDRYKLEVAQPALTWDSYFGHLTTLRNPNYRIRFTNYVEIMAPCFSAHLLEKSLPLFASNLSGWGLDFVWAQLVDHPTSEIAIIDAVTVRHTRPVGGPNYQALRDGGISPWDELRSFCRTHGIDEEPVITTHLAVRRDGSVVSAQGRQRRFALGAISGYLPALHRTPDRPRMIRRLAGMTWKAMCNVPDRVSEVPMVQKQPVWKWWMRASHEKT